MDASATAVRRVGAAGPGLAWMAFALASLAAVLLVGLEGRGTTFRGDDWAYLHRLADDPLAAALFDQPPGQYLIALPMLVFAALMETLGAESYLPYRLLGIALLALVSALVFEFTRRRVGNLLAMPGAVLLLFLGSAAEVVAIPMRVPSLMAIAAALGMYLALERRDRRGDAAAAILGTLAVASHPVALAFIAGAGVRIVLEERARFWRRIWIVLVPAAVYALWMVTLQEPPREDLRASLEGVLEFAGRYFVGICAALTGTFRDPWADGTDFVNAWSVGLALVAVAVGGAGIVRARRISATLAAALATLAVGLVSPVLGPAGALRLPDSPRYIYPGVIFVVLVAAELAAAAGVRPRARAPVAAAAIVAVVFASALYANVTALRSAADVYASDAVFLKAELAALDVARGEVAPARLAEPGPGETDPIVGFIYAAGDTGPQAALARVDGAAAYYRIADAFGTPAYEPSAIAGLPEAVRQQADRVLVEAVPPALEPLPRTGAGADLDCARVTSPPDTALAVPPGRVLLRAAGPATLQLARFAEHPFHALKVPGGSGSASLHLPETRLPQVPWRLAAEPGSRVRACDGA